MLCKSCGGVAHPATGAQYTETMLVCEQCVRTFWDWVKGHTNMVKGVGPKIRDPWRTPLVAFAPPKLYVSFYEAAGRVVSSTHGRDEPGSHRAAVEQG